MRQKTYEALRDDSALDALLEGPDKIFSTYESVPTPPFVVVRLGLARERLVKVAEEEFVHIWAHDVPGDYTRIDSILHRARIVLEALPNTGSFFAYEWFETSPDLPIDPETGTISRFSRFQHISRR